MRLLHRRCVLIALRGQEQFLEAGGKVLEYIPALNDSVRHVTMLAEIILPVLKNSKLDTNPAF
jgi:protoheme ferro-lyase